MAFRSAGFGIRIDDVATQKLIKRLVKGLHNVEPKLRKKVLTKSLRTAAKPIAATVKSNAPKESGQMKRAIKVRAGRRSRSSVRMRILSKTDWYKGDDFYLSFIEFGWHIGKRKSWMRQGGSWSGVGSKGDTRKHIPGQHFFEKAYNSRARTAMKRILDEIPREVAKIAKGGK